MVFQILAFKNCPTAVFSPPTKFSRPSSPVVSLADPGANGLNPPNRSRMPPRPVVCDEDDDGEASPCSALGSAETSCDSVLCWVPAGVDAAWATAADCAVSPPGLVVCCGSANGVSCVAAADEPAYPYIAAASWA